MAQRATHDDPWDDPVNLGPNVNTAAVDFNPTLSRDERTMFFPSDRQGGEGGYVLGH